MALAAMVTNRTPKILVTDANRGSAIAIIRSLGRAGWDVVAADSMPRAIGFYSRYAGDKVVYPNPGVEPERFVQVLRESVEKYAIDLILPVTDAVLQPLMNAADVFSDLCVLGVPDRDAYEITKNKSQTVELAERLGVPTPATRRVETRRELDSICDQLVFPLVVKPESSVKINNKGTYQSFSVSYAENIDSLKKILAGLEGDVAVLLQEYIAGMGFGIEIVAYKGKCLCVFEHLRLAEVPISGGASAWRESITPDPVLLSYAQRLVSELQWTGPIMVEFKVGEKTSLMEINGRVWGSLPLATSAGVDIPRIWAGIYLGEQPPVVEECNYPAGVRTYNLELMTAWIINVILGRVRYPYLPHPGRGEAVRGIHAILSGRSQSDLASKDDPVPARLQRRGLSGKLFRKFWDESSGVFQNRASAKDAAGIEASLEPSGRRGNAFRVPVPAFAVQDKENHEDDPNAPARRTAPVIILHAGRTGLATARCLAKHGIEVYVASLDADDICMHSALFKTLDISEYGADEEAVCRWLADFSSHLAARPVVIPVSDRMVLLLARFREKLSESCIFSVTPFADIEAIVSKDKLYTIAEQHNVPVPSMLIAPDIDALEDWCHENEAPYFVKPFYMTIENCPLDKKNKIFKSRRKLVEYVRENGSNNLIIQQYVKSGDGHIYDCYGYSDHNGKIITMASHKRIRQNPPHRGITSFGEIPGKPHIGEKALFDNTVKLLSGLSYHGIFGIEWMEDRITHELKLTDFNARPFSSIGHLYDCGLNLPYIAYQELTGNVVADLPLIPVLKHKYWLDFKGDLSSYIARRKTKDLRFSSWLESITRSRSFAYFSLRDRGPVIWVVTQMLKRIFGLFYDRLNKRTAVY